MSLFPLLRPIVPQPADTEVIQPNQIENAKSFSGEVGELAALGGDYMKDLNLTDPNLAAAASAIATKAQQVSMIEEVDKQLGEQISLDERMLKAKTGIHSKMAKHQQFLAKNQTELQGINQSHLLAMAGYSQQQQVQRANFNGIVAARQSIAARMRGA